MPDASRRRLLASLACVAAAPPLARPALAQPEAFPSRPVTIVVPFSPGGSTDVVTRLMAERMSAALGKPVQVENKPGGNAPANRWRVGTRPAATPSSAPTPSPAPSRTATPC